VRGDFQRRLIFDRVEKNKFHTESIIIFRCVLEESFSRLCFAKRSAIFRDPYQAAVPAAIDLFDLSASSYECSSASRLRDHPHRES